MNMDEIKKKIANPSFRPERTSDELIAELREKVKVQGTLIDSLLNQLNQQKQDIEYLAELVQLLMVKAGVLDMNSEGMKKSED